MAEKENRIQEVFQQMVTGNKRFMDSHDQEYFTAFESLQTPVITLVTCSDSRIQPHVILPDAINEIFEIENIGNKILSSEGSVDYGVIHLKTPILLIMGHTDCGAIKAYMAGYVNEPFSIKEELDYLWKALSVGDQGDPTKATVLQNVQRNIDYQVAVALEKYDKQIKEGSLAVIGAIYDFRNEMNKGLGRLVIINVNGITDRDTLSTQEFCQGLSEDLKTVCFGRVE